MAEQIIIVVNLDKEKEYGQILKNIMSASGVYEAALWTTKHYTDNEPTLTSSQKIIFIGENNVSKRNLSSVEWKFESSNMKYGWIGSVALLTVGNTLLTKEELKKFKQMCEAQNNDFKKGNFGAVGGIAAAIGTTALLSLIAPISIFAVLVSIFVNNAQKLAKQRKEQYSYLINHFILKDIDNYMVNKK